MTSRPSSIQATPSAITTRQCQRDHGRRSRRAGMSLWTITRRLSPPRDGLGGTGWTLTPAAPGHRVGRSASARDIEHRAGGERTILRRQPACHRGELLDQQKRPIGIFDSMKSMCACVMVSNIAVLAAAGVMQLTSTPRCASLACRATWSARSGPPSSAVVRCVGVAFLAGDRRDVDDATIAPRDHVRHDRAAHQVRRDQVDLDRRASRSRARAPRWCRCHR